MGVLCPALPLPASLVALCGPYRPGWTLCPLPALRRPWSPVRRPVLTSPPTPSLRHRPALIFVPGIVHCSVPGFVPGRVLIERRGPVRLFMRAFLEKPGKALPPAPPRPAPGGSLYEGRFRKTRQPFTLPARVDQGLWDLLQLALSLIDCQSAKTHLHPLLTLLYLSTYTYIYSYRLYILTTSVRTLFFTPRHAVKWSTGSPSNPQTPSKRPRFPKTRAPAPFPPPSSI